MKKIVSRPLTYSLEQISNGQIFITMSKIEDKNFWHLCLVCEDYLKPFQKFNKRIARFKNVNQKNNNIADIILGQDEQ